MCTVKLSQPPPPARSLWRYAEATAALSTDEDAAWVARYAERLARITGCDAVLVYEQMEGKPADGPVLAAHWGLPPDRVPQFQTLPRGTPSRAEDDADGPLLMVDAPEHTALIARLRHLGMRSHRACPFRLAGSLSGCIFFCTRRWDHFHADAMVVFSAAALELGHASLRRRQSAAGSAEADGAAQAKQQFLAVLAHELRNPIAPIRSGLDLIATDLLQPAARASTLEMMQRQLDHLVRLIDDLLDTVRLRTGRIQIRREPVVLREVVRSAIECIRPALFSKHQALHLDDDDADVVLDVDPVRLTQAFINVLSTCAKLTPEGGVIAVSVSRRPEAIEIAFEDEAASTDAQTLDKVFDLFPQAAQKHSDDGIGIGLALVRGLVELNDGTVSVHPREERRGAVYRVNLPLPSEALASLRPVASPAAASWASTRILIVDDNVEAATTLGLLFEFDGAAIRIAHDGPTAVEEAHRFQPEIILLDIGLPGFSGVEAAQRIRAAHPAVAPFIVALTGWGSAQDREATAAAGFDLHLVKPIDHDSLRTQIQELIAKGQDRAASPPPSPQDALTPAVRSSP